MAHCHWCTCGYGVCVEELDFTVDRLEKLVSKAPEFKKELDEYFEDCGITKPNIYDYFAYDEYSRGQIAFILQRVIEEAEGIELCYADDRNCDRYLYLCPTYPWEEVSDKMKNLTLDEVKEVMQKYISILSDKELEYDYQFIIDEG